MLNLIMLMNTLMLLILALVSFKLFFIYYFIALLIGVGIRLFFMKVFYLYIPKDILNGTENYGVFMLFPFFLPALIIAMIYEAFVGSDDESDEKCDYRINLLQSFGKDFDKKYHEGE